MYLKNKKILVTGAAGLIGSNLLQKLLKLNANVIPIYHLNTKLLVDNAIIGDLLDYQFCLDITKNIDIVINCAAASFGAKIMNDKPTALVRPNVIMTSNLLDAAFNNSVEKFVFFASTTGYNKLLQGPVKEEDMFGGDPFEKYFGIGWVKRYGEKLCQFYNNLGMKCIVLRPTNIFGPNDKFDLEKCHVLPALIKKIIEKHNPLEIFGDGSEERDLLYVDDMIESILLAIENLDKYDPINIGRGEVISINKLINIIMDIEQFYPQIKYIKGPRMIPKREVDVSKAQNLLNFKPKISLQDGIKKTIDWYKQNYV